MAGKRYDQHNIAPSEGGATDYKRYPQVTHGQTKDVDASGDRQRLAESQKEAKGQPFPPDVPAPSVHAQEGRKREEDRPRESGERPVGAADAETGKENPLA